VGLCDVVQQIRIGRILTESGHVQTGGYRGLFHDSRVEQVFFVFVAGP